MRRTVVGKRVLDGSLREPLGCCDTAEKQWMLTQLRRDDKAPLWPQATSNSEIGSRPSPCEVADGYG